MPPSATPTSSPRSPSRPASRPTCTRSTSASRGRRTSVASSWLCRSRPRPWPPTRASRRSKTRCTRTATARCSSPAARGCAAATAPISATPSPTCWLKKTARWRPATRTPWAGRSKSWTRPPAGARPPREPAGCSAPAGCPAAASSRPRWSSTGWPSAVHDTCPPASERSPVSDLGQRLLEASYLEGDFLLRSGRRSKFYLDKYLFSTQPDLLRDIAAGLAQKLPAYEPFDLLAGPELGAVAVVTALALACGKPFVIVRKGEKGYGTNKAMEGRAEAGQRVVMVEDIVTCLLYTSPSPR